MSSSLLLFLFVFFVFSLDYHRHYYSVVVSSFSYYDSNHHHHHHPWRDRRRSRVFDSGLLNRYPAPPPRYHHYDHFHPRIVRHTALLYHHHPTSTISTLINTTAANANANANANPNPNMMMIQEANNQEAPSPPQLPDPMIVAGVEERNNKEREEKNHHSSMNHHHHRMDASSPEEASSWPLKNLIDLEALWKMLQLDGYNNNNNNNNKNIVDSSYSSLSHEQEQEQEQAEALEEREDRGGWMWDIGSTISDLFLQATTTATATQRQQQHAPHQRQNTSSRSTNAEEDTRKSKRKGSHPVRVTADDDTVSLPMDLPTYSRMQELLRQASQVLLFKRLFQQEEEIDSARSETNRSQTKTQARAAEVKVVEKQQDGMGTNSTTMNQNQNNINAMASLVVAMTQKGRLVFPDDFAESRVRDILAFAANWVAVTDSVLRQGYVAATSTLSAASSSSQSSTTITTKEKSIKGSPPSTWPSITPSSSSSSSSSASSRALFADFPSVQEVVVVGARAAAAAAAATTSASTTISADDNQSSSQQQQVQVHVDEEASFIKVPDALVQATAMGALAGAIYEDTLPRMQALGHTLVAHGTSGHVRWMVSDSILMTTDMDTMDVAQHPPQEPLLQEEPQENDDEKQDPIPVHEKKRIRSSSTDSHDENTDPSLKSSEVRLGADADDDWNRRSRSRSRSSTNHRPISRRSRRQRSTLVRTFTIRGFDAGDEQVDRERLLVEVCTASPEILSRTTSTATSTIRSPPQQQQPSSSHYDERERDGKRQNKNTNHNHKNEAPAASTTTTTMTVTSFVECHTGLLNIARVLYQDIKPFIVGMAPAHKIVLTGHSIGGALSVLVLLLMTEDLGVHFVKTRVERVYTYGSPPVTRQRRSITTLAFSPKERTESSPPVSSPNPAAAIHNDDISKSSLYRCSVLEHFNLPADLVEGYVQPWDPIVRLFSEIDPFYPLLGDIGSDGVTVWASGPPRTLRPITKAIMEAWDGWPRFRDSLAGTGNQTYQSVGTQYILLPEPNRYLADRFVAVTIPVPPIASILRISSAELLPALQVAFPLDVFEVSYIPQAIRSFVHHFYPAYGFPMMDYVKRLKTPSSLSSSTTSTTTTITAANNGNNDRRLDWQRAISWLQRK